MNGDSNNNGSGSSSSNDVELLGHRGSVSSTRSLDLPITPTRTHKKVSFSDSLPSTPLCTANTSLPPPSAATDVSTPAATAIAATPATPKPLTESELSALNHVLLRTANYLEKLHTSQAEQSAKSLPSSPSSAPVTDEMSTLTPTAIEMDELDSTTAAVLDLSLDSSKEQPISKTSFNAPEVPRNDGVPALHVEAVSDLQEISEEQATEESYASRYNLNWDKNCSSMEVEARREKIRWLLISECSALWDAGSKHTLEAFKRQFMDADVQRKLFHLFDLDGHGYLLQDRWIEHLKGRLNEDKQMDFAEQLESVAYVICGEQSKVTLKNFTEIWKARGILDKLYRLIDVDGTHLVSTNQIMEFISHLTNSRPRTGFDKSSLVHLEQLFRQTVGNEQGIRREEFKKIVVSKNSFFTDRVFQIFDKDNSGTISLQEFIDAIHQFSGQSADDKIRFLFKVYDIDGDGLIQQKEFHDVIRACMAENGMEFSDEQIEELTTAMFEDADPSKRGGITYEALKNQLHKHGGLLENLTITIDRWLVPVAQKAPVGGQKKKITDYITIPHQFTPLYMKNNSVYIVYLLFYIGVNVGLFISRAIEYRASNGFVIVARACGQCLNFNCAWILVLMLRHSITFLRSHGLSSYLPLDHHIYLHKLTGIVISLLSLLHTIMHVFNLSMVLLDDPVNNAGNYTISEWLLTNRPHLFGLVPGCANPTGVALFVILLIMYICSQPFVRRGGSFEIFYWTHLLYIPFWILVFFHAPNFWEWFLIPGLIYIVERVLRMYWMHGEHGKTYISSGILLPSKVIHLVIRRPNNFHFRPGDYVFINIPTIANYEWHPFTISSAPEQEDYMWLHISTAGQWTKKLYEYFEHEQEKLHQFELLPAARRRSIKAIAHVTSIDETADATTQKQPSATPQIDFLSKNLDKLQTTPGVEVPIRPPRQRPSNAHSTTSQPTGRKGRIQSIKRTLERTFSSKSNAKSSVAMGSEATVGGRGKQSGKKAPLERSLTVPDMPPNMKRERLQRLHAIARSESESQFTELVNNSGPKNKSLEQSFRYMRNKPTIIAFKTPSMENCDPNNCLGLAGTRIAAHSRQDIEAAAAVPVAQSSAAKSSLMERIESHINYEVASKSLEIYIDGPYGAPSSHIFGAQHAVLIGAGIGVTPFASILQSIMHRYWKARHTCPRCQYEWASDIPKSVMNLRKVDFFWINRDQRSFEWFVNLLSQLEIEQAELGGAMERFLDMHMYITSALQRNDMKAVGLQLALDLLHEKGKRDLITGLKTRTNAGRPNWDKVFQQLKAQKKGKVTVFYCGPPQLARTLRYKCDEYGFAFRKESF